MSDRQHEIDRQRIDALEAENDELRERMRLMEADFLNTEWMPPIELGLTNSEARCIALMVSRDEVSTVPMFMHALYSLNPGDPPDEKIIDVFICKARRKLKRFDLVIETQWGRGYCLSPASRQRLLHWNTQTTQAA